MSRTEPQNHGRATYWRANLRYLAILLGVWFTVSYGCAIVFGERLDRVRVGGFRLGFWFAQQGSIYAFVIIIFVYARLMNRLDRRHDVDERADSACASEEGPAP